VHYIDCTPVSTCVSEPDADGTQLYPGREVDVIEWTNFH
jgi:hypothetical protein